MSDNLRRYRAIRDALTQWYPDDATGNRARRLATLAALISGIVASKNTQLPQIAAHVPDGAKPESRIKRFARWTRNDQISHGVYFIPYATHLLAQLALQTLVLVIDGSAVGRGCVALMMHVVYKGRALPLCWLVRRGKKGHFAEALHLELLQQVQALIPRGAEVVVLGDGEFDGIGLQSMMEDAQWSYVCRTGRNVTASWRGETFRLDTVGNCLKPGTLVELPDALFTAAGYGPIRIIGCWAKGYQEPLYLVTNMACAEEVVSEGQPHAGFMPNVSELKRSFRTRKVAVSICISRIYRSPNVYRGC